MATSPEQIKPIRQSYENGQLSPSSNPIKSPSQDYNERVKVAKVDITKLVVDAIVNAANNSLLGGGGVDGAIHRAAGEGLVEECETLNGCPTGDAKMTGGHDLPSKHVIHAVGPVYKSSDPKASSELLRSCYVRCLEIATEHKFKSIAFNCLSTGIYGYPSDDAARVALGAVREYLDDHPPGDNLTHIIFTIFTDKDARAYRETVPEMFPMVTATEEAAGGAAEEATKEATTTETKEG